METIRFNNVLPNVFVGSPPEGGPTDVWEKELSFKKGCSYLIEAASGRGKSSFCSFLYGLRSDYQGRIELLDRDGNALGSTEKDRCEIRKSALALMFQEHRLFPELTALENVMLKNQLTGYFTEGQVRQMLCTLGLQEKLDTPCAKLSLGQQQRVAFVRMLAQPADFFLLDEPISHLDAGNAEIMSAILRQRQQQDGSGVIATSIGNRLPYDYDTIIRL
ncbi:MAG: ATP-binding cassette domain-containing protein [Bacteroidaceae bacterium]|nr:ATP-binding cassette domain-containing protein [Bacteroidaceae bacterium]